MLYGFLRNTISFVFLLSLTACSWCKHNPQKSLQDQRCLTERKQVAQSDQKILLDAIRESEIAPKYGVALNEIYNILKGELNQQDFLKLENDQCIWMNSRLEAHQNDLEHIKYVQKQINDDPEGGKDISKGTKEPLVHYYSQFKGHWGLTISSLEHCYYERIMQFFAIYKVQINSGLLKKLKTIKDESQISDGLKYAVAWLIFINCNVTAEAYKKATEQGRLWRCDWALELGENLTATLIAPNLWLWIGRFNEYFAITNRHSGVIEFFLVDLNREAIVPLQISCPEKFSDITFYNGAMAIEATKAKIIQKNNICLEAVDYRADDVVEERFWLVYNAQKKMMEITDYEFYTTYGK